MARFNHHRFTTTNMKNARNEKDYTIEKEAKSNQQRGEESIIAKLFHIAKIS